MSSLTSNAVLLNALVRRLRPGGAAAAAGLPQYAGGRCRPAACARMAPRSALPPCLQSC
ncbi:hypothetical protein RA210_U80164 [Rubrivivax sp. A210]|nr:hypothetical protein RA210_U80164 [Rubrivivax sp. A210]